MRGFYSAVRSLSFASLFLLSIDNAFAQPGLTPPSNSAAAQPGTPKPALSPADQSIKEAFAKTKTATTMDDYATVIALCQDGINNGATAENAKYANKLKAWAHNRRGEEYVKLGEETQALKDFETAAALDPTHWRAVHNRGVSRAATGDLKGALADFDKTISLNRSYANAWYNRGELKYDQGDFAGAVNDYNQAINLQPRDAGYYNSRGHAYYRLGRFREALADYNRAVQIDPQDAAALVNRGDAYRETGVYGNAASDYREAIRINPDLGRAYLSAAWLMSTCPDQRYRNPDLGLQAAKKAIELDGDKDYRYLDTLAAAHANAGDFTQAKEIGTKAAAAAPEKEAAKLKARLETYNGARAFRDGGAPAEAVRSATRGP